MRVEVVGMIYNSTRYLEFMIDQMRRYVEPYPWRIVANDPTPKVLNALRRSGADWSWYHDPAPADHYLSRVYRCVNWYIRNSAADYVVEVNSDMAYSPGWLDALLKHANPSTYPVSQLVQPETCGHAHLLGGDFGSPGNFREDDWLKFAAKKKKARIKEGGLYAPRATQREWFLTTSGFPTDDRGKGTPADAAFFEASGKRHVTVQDSMVYHILEGEMRDK